MKILHCRIENFGKLHALSLDFQEGLNEICAENGWGKSTLAAFIRVMLYGFENERTRDEYTNERKRYQPWQGGVYGGSLTFEADGTVYLVSRTFGLKEKEDTFSLREAVTNLPSTRFSEKLGEELFAIDSASYARTAFVTQNDCKTAVTDSINAKIGDLSELQDDMNSYAQVDAKLHELSNAMSPRRKTGSLAKMREEISALSEAVRREETITAAAEELKRQKEEQSAALQKLQRQRDRLQEQQKAFGVYADAKAKQENCRLLQEEVKNRTQQVQTARAAFGEVLPSESQLDDCIRLCVQLAGEEKLAKAACFDETEKTELETLQAQFADTESPEETLLQAQKLWNDHEGLMRAVSETEQQLYHCQEQLRKQQEARHQRRLEEQAYRQQEALQRQEAQMRRQQEELHRQQEQLRRQQEAQQYQKMEHKLRQTRKKQYAVIVAGCILAVAGSILAVAGRPAGKAVGVVLGIIGIVLIIVCAGKAGRTYDRIKRIQEKADAQRPYRRETAELGEETDPHPEAIAKIEAGEEIDPQPEAIAEIAGEVDPQPEVDAEIDGEADRQPEGGAEIAGETTAQSEAGIEAAMEALRGRISEQKKLASENMEQIRTLLKTLHAPCSEENAAEVLYDLRMKLTRLREYAEKEKSAQAQRESCRLQREKLEREAAPFLDVGDLAAGQILQELQQLKTARQQYAHAEAELAGAKVSAASLPDEEEQKKLRQIVDAYESRPDAPRSMEEIGSALAQTADAAAEVQKTMLAYDRRLDAVAEEEAQLQEKKEQLEALQASFLSEKKKYGILQKTKEYLLQAKTNLTAKYMGPLQESFAQYYRMLTGEAADAYHLDADTNLTVEAYGIQRDIRNLSAGYGDLTGVCLRLALVDAMYQKERPFLILDDPFVNLDAEKRAGARILLEEAAKKGQVLYLTCFAKKEA